MLAEERLPKHPVLNISGRVLFTLLFFLSGVTHFTNIPYYVDLMAGVMPYPVFWVIVSGVVELAGAGMILFNWRPRLGAWLLVVFLVPVTFAVHGVQMVNAPDEAVRLMQQAHVLKGIALIGAALIITQVGVVQKPQALD